MGFSCTIGLFDEAIDPMFCNVLYLKALGMSIFYKDHNYFLAAPN
jgi:hypothetical protein